MRTRTLLVLALACGLAILLAGGVVLVQLLNRADATPPTPLGEPARVGDMVVTVTGSSERSGAIVADVEIGGVDDPDGSSGFRLIASGREAPRRAVGSPGECEATSVEVISCSVAFDTSAADGVSRVLFYRRGDQQARWVLSSP